MKSKTVADSPRATPYWEVLREGRLSSPRLTRSAAKKKKKREMNNLDEIPDNEDINDDNRSNDDGLGGGGLCLTFSPPDHKKNLEHQKKELEGKEKER